MKAKLAWVRAHPDEPSNYEVTLDEPSDMYGHIYSNRIGGEEAWVKWKPFVLIPVEDDDG